MVINVSPLLLHILLSLHFFPIRLPYRRQLNKALNERNSLNSHSWLFCASKMPREVPFMTCLCTLALSLCVCLCVCACMCLSVCLCVHCGQFKWIFGALFNVFNWKTCSFWLRFASHRIATLRFWFGSVSVWFLHWKTAVCHLAAVSRWRCGLALLASCPHHPSQCLLQTHPYHPPVCWPLTALANNSLDQRTVRTRSCINSAKCPFFWFVCKVLGFFSRLPSPPLFVFSAFCYPIAGRRAAGGSWVTGEEGPLPWLTADHAGHANAGQK